MFKRCIIFYYLLRMLISGCGYSCTILWHHSGTGNPFLASPDHVEHSSFDKERLNHNFLGYFIYITSTILYVIIYDWTYIHSLFKLSSGLRYSSSKQNRPDWLNGNKWQDRTGIKRRTPEIEELEIDKILGVYFVIRWIMANLNIFK